MNNTTPAPEVVPAETVSSYYDPTPMDLFAFKGKKIIPEKRKYQREEGLYMYCGDSKHFAAACSRKQKAA